MISDPSLVFYACIAKGTTVLAEFNSKDADLGALAGQCLEKAPSLHSVFSHTVRAKTYTFVVDDSLVYFGIFDEKFEKSEGLSFLNSVKAAFNDIVHGNCVNRFGNLSSHCFQGEFNPVFHQLLASHSPSIEVPQSPRVALKPEHSGDLDVSSRGNRTGSMPLLGGDFLAKSLKKKKKKKKKRLFGGETNGKDLLIENEVDVSDDSVVLSREFSVVGNHKMGLFAADSGHQKAKRFWKKQVWVVLSVDLILCSIMFAVWLWICRGFKCIEG